MKAPAFVAIAWLLAGCSEKSDTSPTSSNPPATNASAPMNAPAGYLGALQKGQQTAVNTIDTTSIDKAIQLFAVENGRNPKSLNELVEQKFLPKIPEAPYGTRLVYDPASGTVKIVSQ